MLALLWDFGNYLLLDLYSSINYCLTYVSQVGRGAESQRRGGGTFLKVEGRVMQGVHFPHSKGTPNNELHISREGHS